MALARLRGSPGAWPRSARPELGSTRPRGGSWATGVLREKLGSASELARPRGPTPRLLLFPPGCAPVCASPRRGQESGRLWESGWGFSGRRGGPGRGRPILHRRARQPLPSSSPGLVSLSKSPRALCDRVPRRRRRRPRSRPVEARRGSPRICGSGRSPAARGPGRGRRRRTWAPGPSARGVSFPAVGPARPPPRPPRGPRLGRLPCERGGEALA